MDADEIEELARELEKEFSNQREVDALQIGMLTQSHIVEMQKDDKIPVKPVGLGLGPLVVKQFFAFLATQPFVRFNPPDDRQQRHAEMLEIANQGLWKLSQGRQLVWQRQIFDVAAIGRGWSCVYPAPQLWAGKEFEQGNDSDDVFSRRLKELKLRRFPIVWRYVDAQSCWATFDFRGEVDQVVEMGEMTIRRAQQAYGVSLEGKPTEKVKLINYADREMAATVIRERSPAAGQRSLFAKEPWQHSMGMNPYILAEAPVLPLNPNGYHWAGSLFDLRHLIEELDGAFSDWRHNTKRQTHSQMVLNLDTAERRSFYPDAKAMEDLITIEPDKPILLAKDERISDQFTGGVTSPDIIGLLNFGLGIARQMAVRPTLLGILEQAGDSAVRYNTASQLSAKQMGPTVDNLILAAEDVTRRLLAAIPALSHEFADIVDADQIPIHFVDAKRVSHRLELGPEDVRGWENRLQARIDLAIPIIRNTEIITGRLAADPEFGLMNTALAMEQFAGIENPEEVIDHRRLDRIRRALDDDLITLVRQRSLELQTQPTTAMDLLGQRFAALPQPIQMALQQMAGEQGTELPGPPEARGAANAAQAGMAQSPSRTVASGVRSGVGV